MKATIAACRSFQFAARPLWKSRPHHVVRGAVFADRWTRGPLYRGSPSCSLVQLRGLAVRFASHSSPWKRCGGAPSENHCAIRLQLSCRLCARQTKRIIVGNSAFLSCWAQGGISSWRGRKSPRSRRVVSWRPAAFSKREGFAKWKRTKNGRNSPDHAPALGSPWAVGNPPSCSIQLPKELAHASFAHV